jgi:RNA polymerase sigma-70 factor, ECF subfamily
LFLSSVERRAYKQAMFAVRDNEVALDLVQDSMLRLAEHYGDRPVEELPMLFQRILQNAIRDHFRRSKVRSLWNTMLSGFGGRDDEEADDPLESMMVEDPSGLACPPDERLDQSRTMGVIEEEIGKLPARQREAFLMRYWEGLDVAETAEAMGCTEGSVKTHCSRAVRTLAAILSAKGITP